MSLTAAHADDFPKTQPCMAGVGTGTGIETGSARAVAD